MADRRTIVAEAWQKLTARERVIVIITLFCVLSALLFQFPYTRLVKLVDAREAKITATEKDITDLTIQIADLTRRAAAGPAISAGWELGDQKSVVLFLEDVSGEARRNGVNLVSVYPAQQVDKEKYNEVSVNLDLKGRYRELAGYFKSLEKLSKLVSVRKIRMESCPDSSSVCAAQVEAVTYVAK
jgi:Tfp pilus assembly protein PilO